ncbi:hypothetical protein [Micromonospora sp. NPDC092111]|uniref:hypothetical protein n=1 Tax=Micromonospora sp. NPDC092111 TaxID=3364289 RepID=UPI0038094A25
MSNARRAAGHTEAFLFTVAITTPDELQRDRSRKLLVKVLPAAPDTDEVARHRLARKASPGFADRHLVESHHGCHPVSDGRWLTFQDVANGGDRVKELGELTGNALVQSFGKVVAALLQDWNGRGEAQRDGLPTSPTTVADYLRRELAVTGALPEARVRAERLGVADLDADWLDVDGTVLPNPLRMTSGDAPLGSAPLDHVHGFSHGDLHGGNILVAAVGDGVDPSQFWLVDLGAYEDRAPLTRDPVFLLLTTLLRWVAPTPGKDGSSRDPLPSDQAEALLRLLVAPEGPPSESLPPELTELIRIAHEAGMAYAGAGNWKLEWRVQQLLSLVGQAIVCTTFDNLGDAGHRWCLRLAAHAAEACRKELLPTCTPTPSDAVAALPAPPMSPAPAGARHFPTDEEVSPWCGVWPAHPVVVSGYSHAPEPTVVPARPGRHRVSALAPRSGPSLPGFRHDPVAATGPATGRRVSTITAHPPDSALRQPTPGWSGRIPHPRRGMTTRPFPPPVQDGTPRRGRLARLAVAVLCSCLASLALPGSTAEREPQGWTFPPGPREPAEESSGGTPQEASPVGNAGPLVKLQQLAEVVEELPEPTANGRYTFTCLHVWSPRDLEPHSDDLGRYQEERLWWTAQRSGRRTVVNVDGRRSGRPTVTDYAANELMDVPPSPPDDPAGLRAYFVELRGEGPPELHNAAGLLQLVGQLHRYRPLGPRQRAALLRLLAETPGITYRGRYPDRAERFGHVISADDGEGRREALTFDEKSGRLLSHETTGAGDSALSYYLFLAGTRTATTTGGRCADPRGAGGS